MTVKKTVSLSIAIALMLSGWVSAFLISGRMATSQALWLVPALLIGTGVGLCLRHVNGRKVALLLAISAATGLAVVNSFFPASRVSMGALKTLFAGSAVQGKERLVQVDSRWNAPPFDQPLILMSPADIQVSLYTRLPSGVDDLCFSPDGDLYASLPALGVVYRIVSSETTPELFQHGLENPTGLLCRDAELLVAESSRVRAYSYQSQAIRTLVDQLPFDGGHLAHRMLQHEQGLLLSIGSRCDACDEPVALRGTLQLVESKGQLKTFARGLRDVGGLVRDQEGEVWLTENSRDNPPGVADEVNRLIFGGDYGWPHCAEGLAEVDCKDKQSSALSLLHRANPADIASMDGLAYPFVYRDSLLVTLQGDSATKVGSAIVRIPRQGDKLLSPVAFLGGWDTLSHLPGALYSGPDGALYVADALNGAIYRVAWQGGE